MRLHLVDAVHLVLDGIFHGDDVRGRVVEQLQGGIERRALAASGRSRDEDQAVRLVRPLMKALALPQVEA